MPSEQVTRGIPKVLRTEEVSLRGSPAEIIGRAEQVARLLVEQALQHERALAAADLTLESLSMESVTSQVSG
jgi:hypothetical protein